MQSEHPIHSDSPHDLTASEQQNKRLELSTQILIGLFAGIACGVFFGEYCAPLAMFGDGFVGLLQMTVVPYLGVTLIASLGRLSWRESRRLAWVGGLVLFALWSAALGTVAVMATVFPEWKSGSFFSTALIEQPPTRDLFSYFIPANIFESLANNDVPGIVLFCICCGIALAKAKDRADLLSQLDVVADVLLRITRFITRLTPWGIFAIAASTAGTTSLTEFARMQAYLVAYTSGAIFLGFVVLPLAVTTITPLTYRQVIRVAKEPMLTAFATGKLIIVLPMLVQNTERLFRDLSVNHEDDQAPAVEALYATAYPFPNVGKLLTILFIPFAAWFLGNPLQLDAYPQMLASGLFAYFGGPIVAIPFLLDQMRLPHDMFELFLVLGIAEGRLSDALGAMHLATLTLISTYGFRGKLQFRWVAITKSLSAITLTGVIILLSVRVILVDSIASAEKKTDVVARMQLLERPVPNVVLAEAAPNPVELRDGESVLHRVRRRGVLRVGFNEDKIPFAFFNEQKQLVGFDVNMAHALAHDLSVSLEFVPFDRATLESQLRRDHFDVVMSGLVGTLERSEAMHHTGSYLDVNLAFVVPDYRAGEFKTIDSIREIDILHIGFVDLSRGFADRLRLLLPEARLIEIPNNRDFFLPGAEPFDALLISAESGSMFTLLYPDYEVVVPNGLTVKLPLFYAIARRDDAMRDLLDHWITLRNKDGTVREYYDHWILGKTVQPRKPRWSVMRDYLHWID